MAVSGNSPSNRPKKESTKKLFSEIFTAFVGVFKGVFVISHRVKMEKVGTLELWKYDGTTHY